MEKFFTYSDWQDNFGEKYITPKYGSRGVMGIDVNRCQKIAAGKNGKIQDRNIAGYKVYLEEFKKQNDLSKVCGTNELGEDIFKSLINFTATHFGMEQAEILIKESERFEKTDDGKWKEIV
jgi:hypothetical protein